MKNPIIDPMQPGSAYTPTGSADAIASLRKRIAKADAESKRLAARRSALGPDASRASVTTVNAKWARAAEYRDRLFGMLDAELEAQATQEGAETANLSPADSGREEKNNGTI